jgi:adenine-specific DNA-methyltransferase
MTLPNLDCKSHKIDTTEAQRRLEQIQLDAAKTAAERNRLGQFATPNPLAIEILNYTKTLLPPNPKIRFLDPAIGTGSFYSALLQTFPLKQIKQAVGYEIDRDTAKIALQLWANTPLSLNIADFTESLPPQSESQKSNLLICNPPYVRHHHLSSSQKTYLKKLVKKITGIELSGLAGLYCYFLLAAHQWMAQDGLSCWLIPAEFMDVNYGNALKQYLLDQVTLLKVHRFTPEDLQFDDVLVSSSLIWLRNTRPNQDYSIEFTYGSNLTYPSITKTIASTTLKRLSKWNITSVLPTPQIITNSEIKLSDLFEIKRGVATGANDFFILTPEQIHELHIPAKLLTPILPSPRYLRDNEILSDRYGNPCLERQLFLLTCTQPIEDLQVQYPSVWHYLRQGEKAGIPERYLCKHRSLWYLQENRQPALFLCPYMGRQQSRDGKPFRFILNHSKAIAPNVYLMMYPKAQLNDLLSANPQLIKIVWQALNSISIQSLIHEGRVYGDGLHKLEPRELANTPADAVLKAMKEL